MSRLRLLVGLLVAAAIGVAAGWIATRVIPARQERPGDSAIEVQKELHREPGVARPVSP